MTKHSSNEFDGLKVVWVLQVFEYLTTDLKKYMDRNGKGPNYPLPKTTIKVRSSHIRHAEG